MRKATESYAMDTQSSERVYYFDESFVTLFNVKFLNRRSPTSPFEIHHVRLMSFATAGGYLYTICFIMRIVTYLQGLYLEVAEVSEVGALISAFLISFCRGTALLAHRKEMRRLLQNLENLFPLTKEDQQKHHLHEYAKAIILRGKVMGIMASFASVLYFTMPIFKSLYDYSFQGQPYVYNYPFIAWHPFDDNRFYTYPIVYILQMAASLTGVYLLLNEDLIFTTSVTYMCMHYRHLNVLLSQVDARFEARSRYELNALIRYQYALEELRDDVDEIFSLSSFIGFTITKTSLCLFLFAIFHGIDVINMLPFMLSFLVLLIPTYLRCSIATDLRDTSGNMIESIYSHNWYEGRPSHRRMITLMMIRANKPALLHASSLNLISLEYFKEILIQTYQIFMFLHNFST